MKMNTRQLHSYFFFFYFVQMLAYNIVTNNTAHIHAEDNEDFTNVRTAVKQENFSFMTKIL